MTAPSTRADPVPGEPDDALPLLVLHIPRTGGSTLKFMLRDTFGRQRSLLDAHWFHAANHDLRRFAVVEGHLSSDFFTSAFGPGWSSNGIAMLRDPVARTVSQARHIRARPGPSQELLRATVRDPADVFERIPLLVNLQTKQLSRARLDAKLVDTDALREATSLLDRLAFGLTEVFDSSTALFMERFRLGIPKFDVANVSRGEHDDDLLSEEFRTAARERNDMDQQLYNHAEGLLRSRIAAFVDSLLALPAGDAALTSGGLRYRSTPIEDHIRIPATEVSARFSGWVLLDGHAADAALVRVGERVVPLVPRIERDDAARRTHDIDCRNAGVVGTVTIPTDARSLELIAFDRARGVRGSQVLEITRVQPDPIVARSAAALKTRINKLRHR